MILRRDPDRAARAALTRLADGSATDAERAELEAAAMRSPELAAELAEQRTAVSLLAALELSAPPRLHERVQALEPVPARRRRARMTPRLAIVAIAVVAVVAVALSRPVGHANVRGVIALALAAGEQVPPAVSPRDHAVLDVAIDRTAFPNWKYLGWRTTGDRLDNVGGQQVETVYYQTAGDERVGYSIVGGATVPLGKAQLALRRRGVSYWVLPHGGATVVSWRRDGHTCVLASREASARTLISLAQAD
jgi:anti-sigma factor RsiW